MLNAAELKQRISSSPAFVVDERQVLANLQALAALRETTGCKVLYAIKALPLASLLESIKYRVDGFSVSSLFEAKLAQEVLAGLGSIHLTTPGIRPDEFGELVELCSHISFNSLPQYQRLQGADHGYSPGLRVNPKLSFAADRRFDPCRPHSKLGVDIELLRNGLPDGVAGLQFHTVFSCRDLAPLQTTVLALRPLLERNRQLQWLNLGGGYLYQDIADLEPLAELIGGLRAEFAIDVYLEPGKAIVAMPDICWRRCWTASSATVRSCWCWILRSTTIRRYSNTKSGRVCWRKLPRAVSPRFWPVRPAWPATYLANTVSTAFRKSAKNWCLPRWALIA